RTATVAGKCHGSDRTPVPLEGANRLTCQHVPKAQLPVLGPGEDIPAVWGNGHALDVRCVSPQGGEIPAVLHIPQAQGETLAPARESPTAIGQKGDPFYPTRRPGEAPQLLLVTVEVPKTHTAIPAAGETETPGGRNSHTPDQARMALKEFELLSSFQ